MQWKQHVCVWRPVVLSDQFANAHPADSGQLAQFGVTGGAVTAKEFGRAKNQISCILCDFKFISYTNWIQKMSSEEEDYMSDAFLTKV